MEQYQEMYRRSIEDADAFWAEEAEKRLHWFKKWDKVQNHDFANAKIRWFEGGKLNVTYNCLDRHLDTIGDKVAYYFEGDSPESTRTITYKELWEEVTKFANVLKKKGVKKGDRVIIYLPMIPELPVSMLACARIGAIHRVVFGGFSADALRDRAVNAEASIMITADTGLRGGKVTPLKTAADAAMAESPSVKECIVVKHTGTEIPWVDGPRQLVSRRTGGFGHHHRLPVRGDGCRRSAVHPLHLWFHGKPKGVMHTTGGYLLYGAMTHELIFDYHPEQVYWCTADIGWVTGHTYVVYAPLANGATSVLFEGVPSYRIPTASGLYARSTRSTSSTPLPPLCVPSPARVTTGSRSTTSPRCACSGTVGEPINPEVWLWYKKRQKTFAIFIANTAISKSA